MIATSLVCLALTLHTESRGEPLKGQVAVASVVMNRSKLNNSTPCDEITKPHQFPWAKDTIKKVHNDYVISEKVLPKGEKWEKLVLLASNILDGTKKIIPRITSFHNINEFPKWKLKFAYKIGNHLFYYA